MGKVIPYNSNSFKPLDYKRVDEKTTTDHGQLNLFDVPKEEAILLPIADTVFDLALKLDLRQDPSAERFYLKAIEKNENTADSLCNLGVIAAHKENMLDAVDCFSKALVEDPRHVESHFNIANVYFALRNYPLATLHYQLVTRIAPGFADGYFNLGLTLLEREELASAKEAFEKYQSIIPEGGSEQVVILLKSLTSLI